ncbi:MAG: c-type cytochrome [Chlorobiaceae bacterium]
MSRIVSATVVAIAFCAASASSASAAFNAAAGKAIYDGGCASCHKTGLAGAPKVGNKAAWAPRISQGVEVMASKSIKGFQGKVGMMPAKGGNAKLTDANIGDAVAYMVGQSK